MWLLKVPCVFLLVVVGVVKGATVIPRHKDVCGKHSNVNEFNSRLEESRNENYDEGCVPKFGLIGDVGAVERGEVSGVANSTEYEVKKHQSGFGFGAIGNSLGGLGEAVFVNGMAVVRSTDNSSSSSYFHSVVGSKFRSTFGLLVLNDCPGDIEATYDSSPSKNVTLEDFHKEFLDDVDQVPFCYFGVADFTFLEGKAIAKAPINNENIFKGREYYAEEPIQLENQLAYIAGCVADLSAVRSGKLSQKLKKVFGDKKGSGLVARTHGVTLKRCLEKGEDIKDSDVDSVFELTEKSKMMSYNYKVYKIDRNKKLMEL